MAKVIVTGGAGFIGSNLIDFLLEQGNEVVVIDNFSTGKKDNLANCIDKIKLIECDLVDWDPLQSHLESLGEVDYFFHLAALPRIGKSVDFPLETHQANTTGTLCALELAKRLGVRKFIFTSSSSVYGVQEKMPIEENALPNPQNPYAVQKLTGEHYCSLYAKMFSLPTTIFRLFNVYGPRMEAEGAYKLAISVWYEQREKGVPLTIFGDGEQTRDFTHISDVIRGLSLGAEYEQANLCEIINLGAGRQVSINHVASLFGSEVVHEPAKPYEERFKEADITKAHDLLGWSPRVSIEEGVAELLK